MFEVKVSGMTCGSCAKSIAMALKSIDPNVEVSVNLKSQIVRVKSDKDQDKIGQIIGEAGFPVLSIAKL